jgi:hypothetical protein
MTTIIIRNRSAVEEIIPNVKKLIHTQEDILEIDCYLPDFGETVREEYDGLEWSVVEITEDE